MKKNCSKSLIICCLCTASLFLNSCATTDSNSKVQKKDSLEPVEIEGYFAESENIVYTNLPHFELLGLLCRLAKVPNFNGYYTDDNSYLEQMATLLGKYENYTVVGKIKEFVEKGITAEAFISLAYHIKPDFSGTTVPLSPKPETLHYEWEKVQPTEITSFVKLLHDFAIESNFSRIYGLNRGMYVADCMNTQRLLDKYKYDQWMQNFFYTENEKQHININVSKSNVAFSYYDFALDENNNRNFYISSFIGNNLSSYSNHFCLLNTQLYASENWNTLKVPFTKLFKYFLKRNVGDDKEAIQKIKEYEVIDWNLASLIAEGITPFYLNDVVLEVDNVQGVLEDNKNAGAKIYGEEFTNGFFNLIQEYIDNRDLYPDFKALYPKLTELILSFAETIPDEKR